MARGESSRIWHCWRRKGRGEGEGFTFAVRISSARWALALCTFLLNICRAEAHFLLIVHGFSRSKAG